MIFIFSINKKLIEFCLQFKRHLENTYLFEVKKRKPSKDIHLNKPFLLDKFLLNFSKEIPLVSGIIEWTKIN